MLLTRKTLLELSGIRRVMLLNHHHTTKEEKTCARVARNFKN
jgi:hypothetical protein